MPQPGNFDSLPFPMQVMMFRKMQAEQQQQQQMQRARGQAGNVLYGQFGGQPQPPQQALPPPPMQPPQQPAPPPGTLSPGGGNPMAQGGASVMAPQPQPQQGMMPPPPSAGPMPTGGASPAAVAPAPAPAARTMAPIQPFRAMPSAPQQAPGMAGEVPPPPMGAGAASASGVAEPRPLDLKSIVMGLKGSGVPADQVMNVLDTLTPTMNAQNKAEVDHMKMMNAAQNSALRAAQQEISMWASRERIRQGDERLDRQETQGNRRLGILERNAERRAREASELASQPLDSSTVDYYARQSLAGDNSWQVGLARGRVGQRLISAVKDRIPQLAAEQDLSPEEASARKGQRDALNAALRDRTKYVAAGNQFVRNFKQQADIVDKYLGPGAAGSVPVINKWIQTGRKQLAGDPDVTALDTAIRGLAREHQRIVTGVTSNAQLHVSAQETADELLNRAMTPAQVKATLQVMREEADNAISAGREEINFLTTQIKTIGGPASGPSGRAPAPKEALDYLKAHPETAAQFSAKYGYLPAGARGQ